MPVLQHVAKVPLRVDLERRGGLRRDPRADDEIQQPPQHREEEVAEADEGARTGDWQGGGSVIGENEAASRRASCPILAGRVALVKATPERNAATKYRY